MNKRGQAFRPLKLLFFSGKGRDQRQVKNDQKYTFFDLRGTASLRTATHPVDDCFRGLLIVHEDRFEQTRSGVSAFEVVLFRAKVVIRDR